MQIKQMLTYDEINKKLLGMDNLVFASYVMFKIQELDLALRKIPKLSDTHLTPINEIIGEILHETNKKEKLRSDEFYATYAKYNKQ